MKHLMIATVALGLLVSAGCGSRAGPRLPDALMPGIP